MSESNRLASMDGLVKELSSNLKQYSVQRRIAAGQPTLSEYIRRMEAEGCSPDDIVTTSETAVELGAPDHLSINAVLWTDQELPLAEGHFSLVGKELKETAAKNDDHLYATWNSAGLSHLRRISGGARPNVFNFKNRFSKNFSVRSSYLLQFAGTYPCVV